MERILLTNSPSNASADVAYVSGRVVCVECVDKNMRSKAQNRQNIFPVSRNHECGSGSREREIVEVRLDFSKTLA